MTREADIDIQALYALARDKSPAGRTALVGSVGDLLFGDDRSLDDAERKLASDILMQVVGAVERDVRRQLAYRLSDREDAPKELVTFLAGDDFVVAEPVLKNSGLLDDADLIEIVVRRTHQHRLAIATRRTVSEAVSQALVDSGEETVVQRLLENADARISQETLTFLVEESRRVQSYREPMLLREELTPELAGRMYRWVSASLRLHILQNFDIDPKVLDAGMQGSVESLITEVRARAGDGKRPVALAELLEHAAAKEPEFLVELLRDGEIPLFEGLFAEITGLGLETATRFIYQAGGEALAIACKAIDMPEPRFASIFLLSRQARPGNKLVDPKEVPRALSVFRRVAPDTAKAVLRRWRHDPDYLSLLQYFPIEQFATLEKPWKSETG